MSYNVRNNQIKEYEQAMSQQVGGHKYLCCGITNPFDDMWGGAEAELPTNPTTGQGNMKQVQDWNNPFGPNYQGPQDNMKQGQDWNNPFAPNYQGPQDPPGVVTPNASFTYDAYEEHRAEPSSPTRSVTSQTRSVVSNSPQGLVVGSHQHPPEDASVIHSVGSGSETIASRTSRTVSSKKTTSTMRSFVDDEDLSALDKKRKIVAKHKAMKMQERLLNGDGVEFKKKPKSKEENERVKQAKQVRESYELLAKTETTRKKRELTEDDVRDPESISGMKSRDDIDREKTAQRRSQQMLDYNQFTSISLMPSLGAYTGMEENKHVKGLKPFC